MSSETVTGFVDDFMASLKKSQVKKAAGRLVATDEMSEKTKAKILGNAKRDIAAGGYTTESELVYRFLSMTEEERSEVLDKLMPDRPRKGFLSS